MASPERDLAKELTRKLHWAVTSTIPHHTPEQRRSTFIWAANLAERLARRPSLPPSVGQEAAKRVGLNGGREGRRARHIPSIQGAGKPPSPSGQQAWEAKQAAMRAKAWGYVLNGKVVQGQLPIPAEVYREVGTNGRTNSTG